MPQIMGGVKIPGPPSLSKKKLPFVKMTENTTKRVKVQHFSRIWNYKKIVSYMPQIISRVKIPGPPLPLLKKTTLRENDRKYCESRKSTALFPHKKLWRNSLIYALNHGPCKNLRTPILPKKKLLFVVIKDNTANRVKVQHFFRIRNYEKNNFIYTWNFSAKTVVSYVFAENPLGCFFGYSRLSTVAFSVRKIHSVVFSVIDGYHGCFFGHFFGYS